MRALTYLLLVLLLTSCGARKPRVVASDRVVKDSVMITKKYEKYIDTITIKADSARVTARFESLTSTPVVVKSNTGRSSVSLSRKGNDITATSNCEALEQEIELQREIIELQRHRLESETITQQVVVNKVPFLWKVGMAISILGNCLLLLIAGLLFLYTKFKTTLS